MAEPGLRIDICNTKGERVELEDDKLYRVVTDFYSSQMLGGVTDLSFGLLSLVPKFADGTPIENYEDAVITVDGKELKAWSAIAAYMTSFEDTDEDGIGNVPAVYGTMEGRKVVENSKNILDLVKSKQILLHDYWNHSYSDSYPCSDYCCNC